MSSVRLLVRTASEKCWIVGALLALQVHLRLARRVTSQFISTTTKKEKAVRLRLRVLELRITETQGQALTTRVLDWCE